ncbi:MAG: aldo/keto reductase [Thermoleophilia bacterium]|nr:aldo/keto reductase [Thermoleophilia bacterium]
MSAIVDDECHPVSKSVVLANGVVMPHMGFGCAMVDGDDQEAVVHAALEAGFRLFDNASLYANEEGIGRALRSGGVPRNELFVSSKLRNKEQGYDLALKGFADSLERLGLDRLDLYLIHWPMPRRGLFNETWRALERLYDEGAVRAIGVSNFEAHHLEELMKGCTVRPMVNQLEFNPYLSIRPLREYCAREGIQVEAWFPLGGPVGEGLGPKPKTDRVPLLENPTILDVAAAYARTPAQVVLRWELQSGAIPLPKSARPERIRDNYNVFDFELGAEDMRRIDLLDCDGRMGPHPDECHDMF